MTPSWSSEIVSVTATDIQAKVIIGGDLGSNKGFTIPGVSFDLLGVTDKDKDDLRFGLEHGVDWVASSFVRSRRRYQAAKESHARDGQARARDRQDRATGGS